MAFVAMLGFVELSAGLLVLTLELLVFDVSIGVWCGGIYALAGAAALVLGRYRRLMRFHGLHSRCFQLSEPIANGIKYRLY